MVVIVYLGLSLVRAKVQARGTGGAVLLRIATSQGQVRSCALSTVEQEQPACGFHRHFANGELAGSIRMLSKERDRVKLGIQTKLLPPQDNQYEESHGKMFLDAPEKGYDFQPGETLRIETPGAGPITVTGEWLDYMPYFPIGNCHRTRSRARMRSISCRRSCCAEKRSCSTKNRGRKASQGHMVVLRPWRPHLRIFSDALG
jgi:hypothetical protein